MNDVLQTQQFIISKQCSWNAPLWLKIKRISRQIHANPPVITLSTRFAEGDIL
jgi:hypothetical protein